MAKSSSGTRLCVQAACCAKAHSNVYPCVPKNPMCRKNFMV
jgi:hypothetical protein